MSSDLLFFHFQVDPIESVEGFWTEQYNFDGCSHKYHQESCPSEGNCDIGRRKKTYHVLAGSVLQAWTKVEAAIIDPNNPRNSDNKMQVIRLRTDDNKKIVGK